jgi:hypothetical protein
MPEKRDKDQRMVLACGQSNREKPLPRARKRRVWTNLDPLEHFSLTRKTQSVFAANAKDWVVQRYTLDAGLESATGM